MIVTEAAKPLVQGWLMEFGLGLVQVFSLQVLAGLWIFLVLHYFKACSVLPRLILGLSGVSLIAYTASFIFDPTSHIVASAVTAYSLAFSVPLRTIQLFQEQGYSNCSERKAHHYLEKASLRQIVAFVAFPAATPSSQHPPIQPLVLLISGLAFLIVAVLLAPFFSLVVRQNSSIISTLWCSSLAYAVTAGVNSVTSALFSFVAGRDCLICKPFYSPWAADSLASFWALHWNVPTHQALRDGIYTPLTTVEKDCTEAALKRLQAAATVLCFAVSGLTHEAVLLFLGVPFGKSRGEWLGFFLAHGLAMLLERHYKGELKKLPRALRRTLTLGFILLSAAALFFPLGFRLGLLRSVSDNFSLIPLVNNSWSISKAAE